MLAGWVQGPREVLRDQPRGSSASSRMEIQCEPAGNESKFTEDIEQIQKECLEDSLLGV